MDLKDVINKKHISYTRAEDVFQICKPLRDAFSVASFHYIRMYKDGSLLILGSNGETSRSFFKNEHSTQGTILTKGIYLWDEFQSKRFLDECAREFQVYNGITIVNSKQDHTECLSMGFSVKEPSVVGTVLNHLDLIEQFVYYFKDKAENLIEQAYHERFILPPSVIGKRLEEKSFEEFRNLIKTNKIHMNAKDKNIILTRREYEVLLQFASGKTSKEAADALKISNRTVEQHLTNAKNKSDYTLRSQLVEMLRDNLLVSR